MSGVIAQLPGGQVQFVPVAPQILIGCLSKVACRLRRVLSPALGFEKPRALKDCAPAEEVEDQACCLPRSDEEDELEEEVCEVPADEEDEDFRVLYQGRDLEDESTAAAFLKSLESGRPCMVRVLFRLLGGKGGFGSLLKNQKGGKKTTNFDAMRDLNGRRIRHVKAVERIKGWLEKKKRDDELVNILTGEGPELPKPTPESESLDPEFLRMMKRAAETRPSIVSAGLKHLLAEQSGSSSSAATKEPAKRARKTGDGSGADAAADSDSVDWLGALTALDELSSPDGEDEEDGKEAAAPAASSASSSSSSSNAGSSKESPARSGAVAPKAPQPTARPAAVAAPKEVVAPKAEVVPKAVAAPKEVAVPKEVELIKPEDLRKYSSAEELAQKVSAEGLKQSLQQLGLKCGGRPEERAKRLFALKDNALEDLPKSFFAAPAKD